MENYIIQAEKHLEDAKKELSKANWFFNRIDKYKAVSLINNSADKYLLGKDHILSKNTYLYGLRIIISSADYMLNYDNCKMCLSYLELCNKYDYQIDDDIIELIIKKIMIYTVNKKIYNMSINFMENIAKNYELFNNLDLALQYYTNAYNYGTTYNLPFTEIRFLKKIAEINIKNNKYMVASGNYKELAIISNKSSTMSIMTSIYLCSSLILKIEFYNEGYMKELITEYSHLYPSFYNSPKYLLITGLIEAYKNKNVDYFDKVITNNLDFDIAIKDVLTYLKNKMIQ